MSTTAIKDVTRALQVLLLSQLSAVSSSAQVSLLPPGNQLPSGLGVNLYLFRIMESAFSRNMDWPGDRVTPPANYPALGLELSYLLTPYAQPPDPATSNGDDAHTMLGVAMVTLHENPILNKVHIPGFDADAVLPASILNSYEQVKITLATTSLEELSKIWATINQPYRLSVAYHVSLIQLLPAAAAPVNGTSVLSFSLDAQAWNAPRLDALSPATGALVHIGAANALVANSLTITGAGLSLPARTPVVQVGGQPATLSSTPAPTATSLTVLLPVDVDGGPQAAVSVSSNGLAGAPLPFLITPWLSRLTPIRSTLENPALALSGIGFTTTPQAVRFEGSGGVTNVTAFTGAVTDTQATINIPATLQNGLYRVRIVLADAANSASNSGTLEIIPAVSSPIQLDSVAVAGNQVHRLTINGARLNGSDVRILVDGVSYATGQNANAAQIVFTLGRLLASGTHTIAVSANGSVSHSIPLVVA
jgi:hypothetical protein